MYQKILQSSCFFLLLAGCSLFDKPQLSSEEFSLNIEKPETAVTYTPVLEGDIKSDIEDLIRDSLLLFRQQDDGAPSPGHLRQRAASGIDTVQKIMRSRGYYNSKTTFEISPASSTQVSQEPAETNDTDTSEITVTMKVEQGELFTLEQFGLQYITAGEQPAPQIPETVKRIPVSQPAVAAEIVAVEARIIKWLLENGYPYAEFRSRDVLANMNNQTLSVSSMFTAGPKVTYGDVLLTGNDNIDEEYLRSYIPWDRDSNISETTTGSYQRALASTQLFDSVAVKVPQPAPVVTGAAPVEVPITVVMEEALFRSIGAGARYSTDVGPIVRFSFEHRNLFGANETLTSDLDAGLEYQRFSNTYKEPQFGRPGQDLVGSFTLLRELSDEFEQNSATLTLGIEREVSPKLSIGAGGLAEFAMIETDEESLNSYLFGIPAFVEYNGSDDLLDPTEGVKARFSVTPFAGVYDEFTQFLVLDGQAATYFSFDSKKRYILALRSRIASIVGADRNEVPRNRRLYAGGGGSVRGYDLRSIGPLDSDDDPTGGTSALELGAEMRIKVTDSIGIVPFLDAGIVSNDPFVGFDGEIQYATGLGFRYYTAIGPIRADVAVPLNGRDSDAAYQLYISIGQAF